MGRFPSEKEVYDELGARLTGAAADAGAYERLAAVDAIVQYRLTEPVATLTLDARAKTEPKVDLGATELEPEVVLSLSADAAEQLFNGELALTEALADGQIAAKGPVGKLLKALPASTVIGQAQGLAAASAATEAQEEAALEAAAAEPEPIGDQAAADIAVELAEESEPSQDGEDSAQ